MKRMAWLLIAVLCSAALLYASEPTGDKDEAGKGKQMTGTVCNSKCVVPQNNLPTCDLRCNDKSGDVVLVDDQGKVMKIANPKMARSHMGKHVKIMAVPTEKEREESLRIMQLVEQAP